MPDFEARPTRGNHALPRAPGGRERILACLSLSPHACQVVRAAKRFADAFQAEWLAVHVETRAESALSESDRALVRDSLRLAEGLGAETAVLTGERVGEEILAFARQRGVSRIVLGKPNQPAWRRLLCGSIVDALVSLSGDIDVYVISGEPGAPAPWTRWGQGKRTGVAEYTRAVAIVAVSTAAAWLVFPYFELSNLIMIYLIGVVGVAMQSGTGPSVLASVLSVAAFDFFFVHPYLTFAVADAQYGVTFLVMFSVALVISGLTIRTRRLADAARQREQRTATLYALSRELAGAQGVPSVLETAARHFGTVFRSRITVWRPDAAGRLGPPEAGEMGEDLGPADRMACNRAFERGELTGLGTSTLSAARRLYVPLVAPRGSLGVLGLHPEDPELLEAAGQRHHLETFARQTALALERAQLAEEARDAQVRAETERLRSSLLSSVSHDLRTPLSAITGAASSLLQGRIPLDAPPARELLETVREEAERLNRLVQNLLQMTRLESGALHVRAEWFPLEEVVGAALGRLGPQLKDRPVNTDIPEDLPLVPMDDVLIEQVLINLLDNAMKHGPADSPIDIRAAASEGAVIVEVADRGLGLRPGEEEMVFEKFYRGHPGTTRGAGLGLAICRGIVQAHGGRISAASRAGGGAVFRFSLPIRGIPPSIGHVAA